MPTILEFANVEVPGGLDGETLYDRIHGEPLTKTSVDLLLGNWLGVRTTDWKLIHNQTNGGYELFDVASDPSERDNRYEANPPVLMPLMGELDVDTRPPRGGWHVRFERGVGEASMGLRLACSSPEGIAAQTIRMGDPKDQLAPAGDDGRVAGAVSLPSNDLDEVVVERNTPEGALALHLEGYAPFRLRLGTEETEVQQWDGQLSANDYRQEPPPAADTADGAPVTVTVWYDLRPPESLGGVDLTPEQEEHLRALGYVD